MSQFQSFDNLLAAMQESILKAHELIEFQHMAVMSKYFDAEGNPEMLKVRIPYHDAAEDETALREVSIPKFALVPQYSLKMEKVKLDFNVKMVSWEDRPERSKRRSGLLTNILYSASDNQETENVHVELSFTAADPPEGVMKINDMLVRLLP